MRAGCFRLLLLAAGLAASGCGGAHDSPTAVAQGPQGASVAGTPVSGEVAYARETMADSQGFAALAAAGLDSPRVIPFLKLQLSARRLEGPGAAGSPDWSSELAAFPGASAPALALNFSGLVDSGTVIPPDTMGAAGPAQLLETLNSDVAVFDKATGTQLSKVTLNTFWTSVRSGLGSFDPRSLYDAGSGMFVAISVAGSSPAATRLLIGVSQTDNALGAWNKFGIAASSDGVTWADFDCLGVDDNNVYVSANMFNSGDVFQFTKIWVFPKTQLVAGSLSTWTEFVNPTGAGFTLQPAHTIGASGGAQYFVHEGYADASPPTVRRVRVSRITFPAGAPTWTDLGYVNVANYPFDTVNAPQAGTSALIETNDTRLLNVVSINGSLWTTHTVGNAAGNRTEIAWYKIDPASARTGAPFGVPLQQGRVADATRFYYFPSIAANASGDAALGFSGSDNTQFVSAYYTGRASTDPDNTMQSVGLLKAGTNRYGKTFGTGRVRWGDYSATVLDPADGHSFWTLQEYAAAPDNTWATWWGKFALSTPTAPGAPFGLAAAAASATQIDLSWVDNSMNESGFLIERSLSSGTGFVQVGTAFANATSFPDGGLSAGTQYFYRVRATNAGGNSAYSNEASATTPTLPAAPTGLTATAVSLSQIDLSWADASTDETGFRVERRAGAGGTFAPVGTAPAGATSFSDGGLSAGTTYAYRVWAVKAGAGDSAAPSNEASATTLVPAGGGGGGGCSMTPGRTADAGSATEALLMLAAPLAILAARRRRRG